MCDFCAKVQAILDEQYTCQDIPWLLKISNYRAALAKFGITEGPRQCTASSQPYKPLEISECVGHLLYFIGQDKTRKRMYAGDLQEETGMPFRKKFIRYHRVNANKQRRGKFIRGARFVQHCKYLLSQFNTEHVSEEELQRYIPGMIYRKQIIRQAMFT